MFNPLQNSFFLFHHHEIILAPKVQLTNFPFNKEYKIIYLKAWFAFQINPFHFIYCPFYRVKYNNFITYFLGTCYFINNKLKKIIEIEGKEKVYEVRQ